MSKLKAGLQKPLFEFPGIDFVAEPKQCCLRRQQISQSIPFLAFLNPVDSLEPPQLAYNSDDMQSVVSRAAHSWIRHGE